MRTIVSAPILLLGAASYSTAAWGFTFMTPQQTKLRSFATVVPRFSDEVASEEVPVAEEPVAEAVETSDSEAVEAPETVAVAAAESAGATETVAEETAEEPAAEPRGKPNEVYVKNISFDATDDDIISFFSQYGEVVSVNAPKYQRTQRTRGYAFVAFASEEQMNAAVAEGNGKEMADRPISVEVVDPNALPKPRKQRPQRSRKPNNLKLYVGNLPFGADPEELKEYFSEHGTVEDIFLPKGKNGEDKGYGFFTFASEEEVEKVIEAVDGNFFQGRRLAVRRPLPEGESANFKAGSTRMYIGNLAFATTEETLNELFKEHVEISNLIVAVDRETNESRGFGFCQVKSEDAQTLINALDGMEVDGRSIRITYASDGSSKQMKIYCGNLAFTTPRETVRDLFQEYGKIINIFMPEDAQFGGSRGFAIVSMNAEDAAKAIEGLNGVEVDGRNIQVNEAQEAGEREKTLRIYVGNLDFDTPVETLQEVFSEFGEVKEILLPEDKEFGGSRGFGFVIMGEEDARTAIADLNGCEIDGRTIKVVEAVKQGRRGSGGQRAAAEEEEEEGEDDGEDSSYEEPSE